MNVYLDTNAVIKLYHHEIGSEELLDFLRRHSTDLILTVADITRVEFHSAFLRRVRTGEIAFDVVHEVFKTFDRNLNMFNVISVDSMVKQLAVILLDTIARRKGLRALDAFQLAAALFCHRYIQIDMFVTADLRFLNVVQEYFEVLNPEHMTER